MAFKGNLKDLSLIDVLQIIAQNQKSGVLKIVSDENHGEIYFNKGRIIDVKVYVKDFDVKIGSYLVSKKIITQDKLQELLEKQKKSPVKFGTLLIKDNVITNDELKKIYKDFMKIKLEKLLSFESGEFEFLNIEIDYDPKEVEPLHIGMIILDALKNIDELKLFKKKVSNLNLVYKKRNTGNQSIIISSDENQDEPIAKKEGKLILSHDAYTIYNMIDGQNSISDIIKKTSFSEHLVLKVFFQLINYGLIELNASPEKKDFQKNSILNINSLKKLAMAVIIIVLSYFISLNLANIFALKSIMFNSRIKKETENRIKKYTKFMNEIETKESEKPELYHNPAKLWVKKR